MRQCARWSKQEGTRWTKLVGRTIDAGLGSEIDEARMEIPMILTLEPMFATDIDMDGNGDEDEPMIDGTFRSWLQETTTRVRRWKGMNEG